MRHLAKSSYLPGDVEDLKTECMRMGENYINNILYTSIKIFYLISLILTIINLFILEFSINIFILTLYGTYLIYFIIDFFLYIPKNKEEIKTYSKIFKDSHKSYIETKNFYLRSEKMLPEFRRYKKEIKNLRPKSKKYKRAKEKHNKIIKQIDSKLKLTEFEI